MNNKTRKFSRLGIEFLGSGGSVTIPKPLCDCRICVEARRKGIPYSRSGPSIFVHGPNILIDTPEEIKDQINRAKIGQINACLYSHWHPDHTLGRRIWESANYDFKRYPGKHKKTPVFLPRRVYIDFHKRLGIWKHLSYLAERRLIKIRKMIDGRYTNIAGVKIKPILLENGYAYGFVIKDKYHQVLIVPDELPPNFHYKKFRGFDLVVLPLGLPERNPLNGRRLLPKNHPLLKKEISYTKTIEIATSLKARMVIFTHIEEIFGLSFREFELLKKKLLKAGTKVKFAYDGMKHKLQ
ncbi:MBL fold metallo-hydrolase [Candidatus Margulisiibacteriota bacterium]